MANDTLINVFVFVNILVGVALFLYFAFAGWAELCRWWDMRKIAKAMKK